MAKAAVTISSLTVITLIVVSLAFSLTPVSYIYTVETSYTRAPDGDAQLKQWLQTQHGVVPQTVHVGRTDDKLVLTFAISRNLWGHPPFPNVEDAASRFGYAIAPNGFTDQRN